MVMIKMRSKVILLLILGISANLGMPIPPTRMEKPIRISSATKGQKVEETSTGHTEETPAGNTQASTGHPEETPVGESANAHETGAKINSLKSSTTSDMNWGEFINALPTLLSFPTTQGLSSSSNGLHPLYPLLTGSKPTGPPTASGNKDESTHKSTVDREYRNNLSHHHYKGASSRTTAATTTVDMTAGRPDNCEQENTTCEYSVLEYDENPDMSTSSAVPSTTIGEEIQYDYIVNYDELVRAIKKVKDPSINKKGKPFPLRDLLLAVFKTGETKQDTRGL